MNNLFVAAIQPDLLWLDPDANLQHLSSLISTLPADIDLVVLPEMFTSGFTEKPELLEGNQQTLQWMQVQAAQHNVAITGSVACQTSEEGNSEFVNRLLFVTPDGQCRHYDKWHLFRMADEHKRYQPGKQRCIFDFKGWRIFPSICYDLRFPVFCRNRDDYDLMLCVANWPVARRHQWRTLLQARAIENQAYVVGVNRVGTDGNNLQYQGDSLLIDYAGMVLQDGGNGEEQVLFAEITVQGLRDARNKFPVIEDADSFKLL